MFSLSEIFLIIMVALLVLGPNSLQKLLCYLAVMLKKHNELLTYWQAQWRVFKKEQRLEQDNQRAQSIDERYKKK